MAAPHLALSRWLPLTLLWVAALAPTGTSQEREPGRVLPARSADILLGEWRKIERRQELLARMGLRDGHVVADVGAGIGWYSLEVAKRVAPHGMVFAVDIQNGMLRRLRERMEDSDVRNVHTVLGREDDPLLPPGKIDWVLLVDAYHEFTRPVEMLAHIKDSLAPGGRVALLEFRAEQRLEDVLPFPRSPELEKHFMSIPVVMQEWTAAGFELDERAEFLPSQHVFIFKVPGDTAPSSWQGGASIRSVEVGTTPSVSTFGDDVYLAGQVAEEDFARFAELGIATIVNLRTQDEVDSLGFDEAQRVEEAGMRYLRSPMGPELPSDEQLAELLDTITRATAGEGKVLVHCAGAGRAGAVWAAFRTERHGLSLEESLAEAHQIGMQHAGLEEELKARFGPR